MPLEAAPTTAKLTKDKDGGLRLAMLLPDARRLLKRFDHTEVQLQQIKNTRAGESLTIEIGQVAAPTEKAPSGLLTIEEELATELKITKASIRKCQYVDGDLLSQEIALLNHLRARTKENTSYCQDI